MTDSAVICCVQAVISTMKHHGASRQRKDCPFAAQDAFSIRVMQRGIIAKMQFQL